MGFSLGQIKKKLDEPETTWEQSLGQQLDMVKQQQKQLQTIEQALNGVLHSIQFEEEIKWPLVFEIIQLFQRDKDVVKHLYENYLNEKEQKAVMNLQAEKNKDDIRERSEEHTSELQSRGHLVCRLLL